MGLFKSVFAVARINFKRWVKDSRVYFIGIFIAYLIYFYIRPFAEYGIAAGQSVSGWMLPFMFQSGTISVNLPKILFHLGMLILLCDAPFFTPVMPYMVLRSRRNSWWMGECLYIMGTALIYTVFLSVVSTLMTLPVTTFDTDWGEVMHDLAFGTEGMSGRELVIEMKMQILPRKDMIIYLYPQGTYLYTFVAVWCVSVFLGLLMYLITLATKNIFIGMSVACGLIFFDPFILWIAQKPALKWLEYLSPVSWSSVERMQSMERYNVMSIPLALGIYAALIVILCAAIWRCSKKVMIETIELGGAL